tara:strand:- start:584 stop:937 length:354 start_codon:yes stop_codon:yes gene_type:complete
MIIVYTKFEDKIIPILGEELVQDPILPNNFLIKGVSGVSENAHPNINVHSLSTSKENVSSYLLGETITSPEKVEDTNTGEVVPSLPEVEKIEPTVDKSAIKRKNSGKKKRKRSSLKN